MSGGSPYMSYGGNDDADTYGGDVYGGSMYDVGNIVLGLLVLYLLYVVFYVPYKEKSKSKVKEGLYFRDVY